MKKNRQLLCPLILLTSSLLLTGCSKTISGVCYAIETTTSFGSYIARVETDLTNGTIVSSNIKETYLPCVWARVNPEEKSDATIETIQVDDANLFDGTTGTIYLAKNITIGDYSWVGTLRDVANEDEAIYYNRGDYVHYKFSSSDTSLTDETLDDLTRYLTVADSTVFKLGSHCQWYYEALESGNFHAYGKDSSGAKVDYTPSWPGTTFLRNDSSSDSAWKSSTEALCNYFKDKKINYAYSTVDTDGNTHKSIKMDASSKTFMYNPEYINGVYSDDNWQTITGCTYPGVTLDGVKTYFDALNKAFASEEYNSRK